MSRENENFPANVYVYGICWMCRVYIWQVGFDKILFHSSLQVLAEL